MIKIQQSKLTCVQTVGTAAVYKLKHAQYKIEEHATMYGNEHAFS